MYSVERQVSGEIRLRPRGYCWSAWCYPREESRWRIAGEMRRYLGESAGVRGNRPGDELVLGDGPDHGGNRNPPPCLLSGVRKASWCVHTWGDGCCCWWCLCWRNDQNLDRGLLHEGVVGGCCGGDGGGVAGGGDRLGDHTGQDGDLIIIIAFSSRYMRIIL